MPTTTWSHRDRKAPPSRLMMMMTSASVMRVPLSPADAGRNITPAAQRGTDHPVPREDVDRASEPGISYIWDGSPAANRSRHLYGPGRGGGDRRAGADRAPGGAARAVRAPRPVA